MVPFNGRYHKLSGKRFCSPYPLLNIKMLLRMQEILEKPMVMLDPKHRAWPRKGCMVLGSSSVARPAWGGMWSLPQLLPIKQSWHFTARQRRWLPALEVSVWPSSQPLLLPSADPLTSAVAAVLTSPLSSCPHLNGGIQGLPAASLEGTSFSPLRVPLATGPAYVGGVGNITEGWIVDRGQRNAPHITACQGSLPTMCPLP